MKVKLIAAAAILPLLLSSCGGSWSDYDIPEPDLHSCIIGSWTLHDATGDPNRQETILTFNEDRTYTVQTIEKARNWFAELYLYLLWKLELPDTDDFRVRLEEGRYDLYENSIRMIMHRYARSSGDDLQVAFDEAVELLAATEPGEYPSAQAEQIHCDKNHFDKNVWTLISETPVTYERTTFSDFDGDVPGKKIVSQQILHEDGTADKHVETTYINHLEGIENTISDSRYLYEFSPAWKYTYLKMSYCPDGNCELASGYPYSDLFRGTAITSSAAKDYYFR